MPFEIEAAVATPEPVARGVAVLAAVGFNAAEAAPSHGPCCGPTAAEPARPFRIRTAAEAEVGDRVAAYLVDPSAVHGAGILFDQKRSIDSCAARMGLSVSRYYCDSGRPDGAPVGRHHLERLLVDACAGAFSVVIVNAEARFRDPAGTATAERLARLGIEVRYAAGARPVRRTDGASAAAAR